jgi:hypothetical protein
VDPFVWIYPFFWAVLSGDVGAMPMGLREMIRARLGQKTIRKDSTNTLLKPKNLPVGDI